MMRGLWAEAMFRRIKARLLRRVAMHELEGANWRFISRNEILLKRGLTLVKKRLLDLS